MSPESTMSPQTPVNTEIPVNTVNPMVLAARAGVRRGFIELRHTLTTAADLSNYLFPTAILLTVMFFMRNSTVPGTDFSMGARTLPSAIGMGIVFSGLATLAAGLAIEREDGTLLRAKAVPNGMFGHLVGKVVLVSLMGVISLLLLLIPGMLLLDGVALDSVGAWATLAWVFALGMVATLPLGAIFGSLLSNPRNMGLVMLPTMGLVATSGIFYPITNFPVWLQGVAQAFPIYWLGLGMRSAMLPDELAAVEFDQSWRHLETAGVLGVWAVLGLLVAPMVLRRMARRESGSSVAARREKAIQRVT
jgi:ABC-2 type transport system permease protein